MSRRCRGSTCVPPSSMHRCMAVSRHSRWQTRQSSMHSLISGIWLLYMVASSSYWATGHAGNVRVPVETSRWRESSCDPPNPVAVLRARANGAALIHGIVGSIATSSARAVSESEQTGLHRFEGRWPASRCGLHAGLFRLVLKERERPDGHSSCGKRQACCGGLPPPPRTFA